MQDQLANLSRDQRWLANEVARLEGRATSYSQGAISKWKANPDRMKPGTVFAVERALKMPPGSLSREFGYVPAETRPLPNTRDAIANDGAIDAVTRGILLSVYDEAVARSGSRGDKRRKS
jgi:hypothetical protein